MDSIMLDSIEDITTKYYVDLLEKHRDMILKNGNYNEKADRSTVWDEKNLTYYIYTSLPGGISNFDILVEFNHLRVENGEGRRFTKVYTYKGGDYLYIPNDKILEMGIVNYYEMITKGLFKDRELVKTIMGDIDVNEIYRELKSLVNLITMAELYYLDNRFKTLYDSMKARKKLSQYKKTDIENYKKYLESER